MLEWLIIGGGIHGTHLLLVLQKAVGIPSDGIRILDPNAHLLAVWHHNAANCDMPFLRSPSVHNLDLAMMSLMQFAKKWTDRGRVPFIDPYYRPARRLFQDHCRHVVLGNGLDHLHLRGAARSVEKTGRGYRVETDMGTLEARRVLLAIGQGESPLWPPWACLLRGQGAKIDHVFDPSFDRSRLRRTGHTTVVGGGISAVQTALSLASEGERSVSLISRHDLRINNLDFDPCWAGPKCLKPFRRKPRSRRGAIVRKARYRGTVPVSTAAELEAACREGRIVRVAGDVRIAEWTGSRVHLHLTTRRTVLADRVVLCTGFETKRPGGAMVDRLVDTLDLKTDRFGYPIVGKDLRWHTNLFVSGPLGELFLGPGARNIVGARQAGRLLRAALKQR